MIRAGLFAEAKKLVANPGLKDEGFIKICEGELALARGQVEQAIPLLEDGLNWNREDPVFFHVGFESLAEAYERRGDSGTMLAMLKESSIREEYRDLARVFWLRNKAKLLQRYRRLQKVEEVHKLEEELKSQLRLADADHPILLQLRQAKGK
jgi:predicted Zn-dependent protease